MKKKITRFCTLVAMLMCASTNVSAQVEMWTLGTDSSYPNGSKDRLQNAFGYILSGCNKNSYDYIDGKRVDYDHAEYEPESRYCGFDGIKFIEDGNIWRSYTSWWVADTEKETNFSTTFTAEPTSDKYKSVEIVGIRAQFRSGFVTRYYYNQPEIEENEQKNYVISVDGNDVRALQEWVNDHSSIPYIDCGNTINFISKQYKNNEWIPTDHVWMYYNTIQCKMLVSMRQEGEMASAGVEAFDPQKNPGISNDKRTYTIQLSPQQTTTICLPFDAEVEGAELYTAKGKKSEEGKKTQIRFGKQELVLGKNVAKAGVPYTIFVTAPEGVVTFRIIGDVPAHVKPTIGAAGFTGTYAGIHGIPSYSPAKQRKAEEEDMSSSIETLSSDRYVLTNTNGKDIFVKADENTDINAFDCYVECIDAFDEIVEDDTPAENIIDIEVFEEMPTSINGIYDNNAAAIKSQKIIKDGRVIISKDGKQYNVMGIQVK